MHIYRQADNNTPTAPFADDYEGAIYDANTPDSRYLTGGTFGTNPAVTSVEALAYDQVLFPCEGANRESAPTQATPP